MGIWFWLYTIVNLSLLFVFYRKKNGVFQAPFLMAYTSIFVLLPQFSSIYISKYCDKELIGDLGFMMVASNIAFVLGFELAKRNVHKDVGFFFSYKKIQFVLYLFTCLGVYSIFTWEDTYQGADNVIQANLKTFSQYALCLSLTFILCGKKKWILYVITILNVIPLVYFAFFVKGSRGETIFLIIVLFLFLSLKYREKERLYSKIVLLSLIIGGVLNASILLVRNILVQSKVEKNVISEKVILNAFVSSFKQDTYANFDLSNAAKGIKYLKETSQADYGTSIWDAFVQNYVPRRVVGLHFKEGLKIKLVNDQEEVRRLTQGVTTMTGYYGAFRCLFYSGFILFGVIGYVFGYYWIKKDSSQICLFIYFSLIASVPLVFTHGVDYWYTRLFFIFFIFFPMTFYTLRLGKRIK